MAEPLRLEGLLDVQRAPGGGGVALVQQAEPTRTRAVSLLAALVRFRGRRVRITVEVVRDE